MDETILSMRKKTAEKNQKNILGEPLYIGNERFTFERKTIGKSEFTILLPKEFVILPEEVAKIKYPNESRPKEIWTNLSVTTNFGFNLLEESFPETELSKKVRELVEIAKKLNGNYTFSAVYVKNIFEEKRARLLVWYTFISPSLTEPVYNLCSFQIINKKIVHSIFNCEATLGEVWQTAVLEVFSSVEKHGGQR